MHVYIGIVTIIFSISLFLYWRFFFRNPKRTIPYNTKSILSPADGIITYCKKIKHDFLNKFKNNKRLFKLYYNILFLKKPLNKILTFKDNEKIKQGEVFGLVKMSALVVKVRQGLKAGLTELIRIKN